jgi:nucleolysin TIA-1/TIAR
MAGYYGQQNNSAGQTTGGYRGNHNKSSGIGAEFNELHNVYVGDFGPEVDSAELKKQFAPHGDVVQAKVILDSATQTSKGYGFVGFAKREHAERAIAEMNGQWIGYSLIKVNWATRKPASTQKPYKYDDIYRSTSATNTTVYIGGLDINTKQEDINDLCAKQATVVDIKLHPEKGYGFVKYATKDEACRAIVNMHGYNINGTILKCNWGKEDVTGKNYGGGAGGSSASGMGFYGANAMDASQAAMASQMTPYGSTASGDNNQQMSQLQAIQQAYIMQFYQQQQAQQQQLAMNPQAYQQYMAQYMQQIQQQQQQQGGAAAASNGQQASAVSQAQLGGASAAANGHQYSGMGSTMGGSNGAASMGASAQNAASMYGSLNQQQSGQAAMGAPGARYWGAHTQQPPNQGNGYGQ